MVGFGGSGLRGPVVAGALHRRQPRVSQRAKVERRRGTRVSGRGERVHLGHRARAQPDGGRRRYARCVERDARFDRRARIVPAPRRFEPDRVKPGDRHDVEEEHAEGVETAPAPRARVREDSPDDRGHAQQAGDVAERPRHGIRNEEGDVFPRRIDAVGIGALDPRRVRAPRQRRRPKDDGHQPGGEPKRCAQRLLYWNRLRARLRPYFFDSFSRGSRVRNPCCRMIVLKPSSIATSARAMPWRTAPA